MVTRTSLAVLAGLAAGFGLTAMIGIPLTHPAAPFVLAIGIGLGAVAVAFMPARRKTP